MIGTPTSPADGGSRAAVKLGEGDGDADGGGLACGLRLGETEADAVGEGRVGVGEGDVFVPPPSPPLPNVKYARLIVAKSRTNRKRRRIRQPLRCAERLLSPPPAAEAETPRRAVVPADTGREPLCRFLRFLVAMCLRMVQHYGSTLPPIATALSALAAQALRQRV
jgi:hypothetical protein